jgi:Uri superfamily endonuclease
VELRRIRTHRDQNQSGQYRWYNDYLVPESYRGGQVTVRLHATDEDRARRFNRTENVRPIPPSDPDFPALYSKRNDAESINRGVVDSHYLGRAHSLGHARQHLNLLGYALMVNSVALHDYALRRVGPLPTAA